MPGFPQAERPGRAVAGLRGHGEGLAVFGRARPGQEIGEAGGALFGVEGEEPLIKVHAVGQEADSRQSVLGLRDPSRRLRRRPEHVRVWRGIGVGDVGHRPAAEVRTLELQEGISGAAVEHLRGGAGPEPLAAHDGPDGEAALGGHDRSHRPLADRKQLLGPDAREDVEVVAAAPEGHVLAVFDLPDDPALDGRYAPLGVVVRDEDVGAGEGELDAAGLFVLGEAGHRQERRRGPSSR